MRGLRRISTLMCSTTLVLAACSREPEQPAARCRPRRLRRRRTIRHRPAAATSAEPEAAGGFQSLDQARHRHAGAGPHDFPPVRREGRAVAARPERRRAARDFRGRDAEGSRDAVRRSVRRARPGCGGRRRSARVRRHIRARGSDCTQALQGQVRGCDEPAASYIVAARGSEPFWAVEVGGRRHRVAPAGGAEGDRSRSAADAGRGRRSALSRQRQRPRARAARSTRRRAAIRCRASCSPTRRAPCSTARSSTVARALENSARARTRAAACADTANETPARRQAPAADR